MIPGYLVIGTMEKKACEKGLHDERELAATVQQIADFKKSAYPSCRSRGLGPGLS
jgi:hypothetical protein